MLKALLSALVCAWLLCACALADPLLLADDVTGDLCFPEGTSVQDARFVFHYAYPHAAGDSEEAQLINNVYAAVMSEDLDFHAPITYESLTTDLPASISVTYEVTCSNDDYICFLFTTRNCVDGYDMTVYSAQVFSRRGGKAGQVNSLPYLLGILAPGETDTWLQDRQTAKADACIRHMILEQLELEGMDGDIDEEYLEYCFYPEEDFYMDADGALVFFLQPEDDRGWLTFRFTFEEILDEL